MDRERVLVSRRVYHVCMGVLEASLYAVPISFLIPLFLSSKSVLTLLLSVVLWAVVWVWVMRRSVAKFERTQDAPAAGSGDALQNTILRYTALASAILLGFIAVPPLLPDGAIGALLTPSGVLFFCCVILFTLCAAFCTAGLVPAVGKSVYPEYPGISATFIFALAMAALFFSALTGF